MARNYDNIKSESLYETGSRKAVARLAKRVGMDLRQTATKVANSAGFSTLTSAHDEWRNDPQYERTLFRDFLLEKANERLGPGAVIPNSMSAENYGQTGKGFMKDMTGKQLTGIYAAAENGDLKSRVYKDKDGNVVGEEVITKDMDAKLRSMGVPNLLEGIIKEFENRDKSFKPETAYSDFIKKLGGVENLKFGKFEEQKQSKIVMKRGKDGKIDFVEKGTPEERRERQRRQEENKAMRDWEERARYNRERGLPPPKRPGEAPY